MAMHIPKDVLWFPPISTAEEDGLVAITSDLSIPRLILAYKSGLFPWFQSDEYYFWFAPNPRCVIYPSQLKVSHSMKPILNQNKFQFAYNTQFTKVMQACANTQRKPVYMDGVLNANDSTWINSNYIQQYTLLNQLGYAISAEAYLDGQLVGGLYGVLIDKVLFGESMFSLQPNASKFAFIKLVQYLQSSIHLQLIDCQQSNPHLHSLGAVNITSSQFQNHLQQYIKSNL
jgi:leucyl/phenylalanyl-tRNA---protein transferase